MICYKTWAAALNWCRMKVSKTKLSWFLSSLCIGRFSWVDNKIAFVSFDPRWWLVCLELFFEINEGLISPPCHNNRVTLAYYKDILAILDVIIISLVMTWFHWIYPIYDIMLSFGDVRQGWAGMTFGHLGTGTGMAQPIPKLWEREREWKSSFPTFGNGNGNEKLIPKLWEREWEVGIPGNGREREFPLTPAS